MQETVAHEWGVSEESVAALESDEGDLITVDGMPVYRVSC
jgi:DNA-binding XRE family transcriptional regulator